MFIVPRLLCCFRHSWTNTLKTLNYMYFQKLYRHQQDYGFRALWCKMTLSRQPMTTNINTESTKTCATRTWLHFSSKSDRGCGNLKYRKGKTILWQSWNSATSTKWPEYKKRITTTTHMFPLSSEEHDHASAIFCKKRLAHQCVYR